MKIHIVKKAEKKTAPSNNGCTFIIEGLPEPRK
jgi:hypothetical protein